MLADYKVIAEKLADMVITVGAKVGTTEKIFGNNDIYNAHEVNIVEKSDKVEMKTADLTETEIKEKPKKEALFASETGATEFTKAQRKNIRKW